MVDTAIQHESEGNDREWIDRRPGLELSGTWLDGVYVVSRLGEMRWDDGAVLTYSTAAPRR